MSRVSLSVGILSADFFEIKSAMAVINASAADAIHFDVMDGVFVPNITFGAALVRSLRKHSRKVFDVHLMLADPLPYVRSFADAGADIIKLHVESKNFLRAARLARSLGVKVGMAVNASTPFAKFKAHLPIVDSVMLMTAKTGFAGQPFQARQLAKIKRVAAACGGVSVKQRWVYPFGWETTTMPAKEIQVDGGMDFKTAKLCVAAGANSIVSGSFIFKQRDFNEAAERFKSL